MIHTSRTTKIGANTALVGDQGHQACSLPYAAWRGRGALCSILAGLWPSFACGRCDSMRSVSVGAIARSALAYCSRLPAGLCISAAHIASMVGQGPAAQLRPCFDTGRCAVQRRVHCQTACAGPAACWDPLVDTHPPPSSTPSNCARPPQRLVLIEHSALRHLDSRRRSDGPTERSSGARGGMRRLLALHGQWLAPTPSHCLVPARRNSPTQRLVLAQWLH